MPEPGKGFGGLVRLAAVLADVFVAGALALLALRRRRAGGRGRLRTDRAAMAA